MHVKRFQEVSTCLAAVLSIKACNSGITLTAAQLVIFAELDWNPSVSNYFRVNNVDNSGLTVLIDSSTSRKSCSPYRSGR